MDPVVPIESNGDPWMRRLRKQSTYRIQWAWLSIPIATEVLALMLLLLVATWSHDGGIPIWKSSALAMMYHRSSRPTDASDGKFVGAMATSKTAPRRNLAFDILQARLFTEDYATNPNTKEQAAWKACDTDRERSSGSNISLGTVVSFATKRVLVTLS